MENSFVYDAIRKSNRILFGICGGVMLILIALLAVNWRYFYNFAFGPFNIDNATLSTLTDPSKRLEYFVTVKADDAADSGFQRVTTSKSGNKNVEANFPVLLVGQKVLLVETTATEVATKYTGALKVIPAEVNDSIVTPLGTQVPELVPMFLPYMLNANNFRKDGIIGLGIGIPVFILCIVGAVTAFRRTADPARHPAIKQLGRFGPVDFVTSRIDAEMDSIHKTIGSLHLTNNWLVNADGINLQATRFDDLIWFYKQITQHRTNGIPTGKTFSIVILDRFGKQMFFNGKEALVDEALDALSKRAPWAVMGHSPDLEKTWKSDREAMIAAVDQRRGVPAKPVMEDPAPEA